ncbi:MAG: hypothetical protein KIT17_16310 [Rubrivivax sp.]|nr:hypothetical protein [Rubrivivax sp.]
MKLRTPVLVPFALAALLALGSCGGGGGGGGEADDGAAEQLGVFTGFPDTGNLNWESTGGDGSGGVGDGGASGDGGVGAGGDFGQFRGARICVFLDNGTELGCALTDDVKGMVTIKPGRSYRGGLRIELSGTPTATYYEEGRNVFVPFPADRKIRVWVPFIQRNIGITPFTEAAYRMLTEGSAPESAGPNPTKDQVRAANERVRAALNEHFPSALHVDDIARLPFIKSPSLPAGSMGTDPRGRYGLVNGAFSKQASFHNSDTATPTLDAVRQLAEDLLDGRIDGRNGDSPAGPASARTYDPNTFTSELSSALAEQAARFGAQEALDALPRVLNFGNVRYEGYLFDGSISKAGNAFSTVAGWVAGNSRGLSLGQQFDRLPGQRALALYANNGHGGGFYKADALGPRHKVYAIGDNVNGELGLGTRDSTQGRAVEVDLPGALTHAVGGFAHTIIRVADGRVFAWGDNTFGQLGQGQGADTLPSSLAPLQVQLPRPALAVAATNIAGYALLDDGTVWAWGSNGGFGLLGNGARDGMVATPTAVSGLTQVVQMSARDNDVVVVRRDNTVWHWGSFPADEGAFDAGDPSAPYRGGTMSPVQVAGLPAGVPVRKVLTEQGLFVALLANGHAYHWGVHFDLTAGGILRDLTAQRILGLPPVRDLMPGGFIGYGARPFDRLTGMAVDYSGGMWKVRGRVAERFDPADPSKQNRPQGAAARPDCISCHTFLDESLEQLRARQPSTAGLPVCQPPDTVHAPGGVNLLHAETDCVFCHNPSRANYPQLAQPFAGSGSWQNCAKPDGLPPRAQSTPAPQTNSCTVPVGHVYTPPGTVCASCHNSIIARPLNALDTPCAQPRSDELPAIANLTTITGVFDLAGNAIAAGSTTNVVRHQVRGTLSQQLAAGQTLEVSRNGAVLGSAAVGGTTWTYTHPADAPQGGATFTARVVASGAFGRTSNTFSFNVDSTPPTGSAAITGFTDDTLGPLATGAFASDTTPTVNGTLSAALGSGESVQVLRGGSPVGLATVNGGTWSFTEPAALAAGTYSWQARTIDGTGNATAASAAATLTIVTSMVATNLTQVVNDATSVVVPPGGATNDSTPLVRGTVGSALPPGHVVRVLRNGVAIGTAAVVGTDWTFTDPGGPDGTRTYVARTEAGAVLGTPSGSYTISVDTVPPAQTANVTQIADDFIGPLADGATTADTTPIVSGTLSAPLAEGEQVRVLRRLGAGAFVQVALVTTASQSWSYTEPTPLANGTYTYQVQVVDAAGQLGPLGAARSVVVDATAVPLPGVAATIATINGVAPSGGAVPANNITTPVVAGTIQRTLLAGEVVRIYRGLGAGAPAPVGTATVTSTSWTYTNSTLADGTYTFRARVERLSDGAFGLVSATITVPIDATAPTQTVTITNLRENSGGTIVANNGHTTDTTPFLEGTLSAALGAGEQLQVLRNGVVVANLTPGGTSWTYQEGALTVTALYTYTLRVRDAAGNLGPTSAGRGVNIVTNLPTTTITSINGLANGAATNDTTPTVNITLSANLPSGYLVRIFRNGGSVATLGTCAPSCSFIDGPLPGTSGTTYNYTARTEVGGTALGAISNTRTIVLDTAAPAAPSFQVFSNNRPFQNNTTGWPTVFDGSGRSTQEVAFGSGVATSDPDPRVQITFSVSSGDTVQLFRGGTLVASTTTVGQTTLTVNHPASLARPPSAPNTVADVTYTARRTDAAGNFSDATFVVNVVHPTCNRDRALSRSNNTTHQNWLAGSPAAAGCTACHGTTSGNYLAAPPTNPETNNLNQGSWYWCFKS